MRKISILVSAVVLVLSSLQSLSAKEISVEEAMSVADRFQTAGSVLKSRNKLPLKHVYTESVKDLNCVYVFTRGAENGYVVVAGDDLVETPVLGYSDSGSFDAAKMPENMKWWLGEYARQIEYLNRHPEAAAKKTLKASAPVKEVAPILTCKWDQGTPYNILCPELNWKRSYVGCVATATAQVMYHHKFPSVGTGTKSYRWKTGSRTITEDFSKYPFDWNNMKDVYTGNETNEQNLAVATLCYCAGVAAEMDYSPSGSGTYNELVPPALYKYFGYDDAMITAHPEFYTREEWDNMLRRELDANRPVLYSGANSYVGHAFVLDGYNAAGYFHVNWGWSGMSDGYFKTTALDPAAQGAGGSDAGYNVGQTAAIGLQPETPSTEHIFQILQNGNFFTQTPEATAGSRVRFDFDNTITMESVKERESFYIGVGIYNDKNQLVFDSYLGQLFDLPAGMSYSNIVVSPTIPTGLADGIYTVCPVFKASENAPVCKVLSKVNKSGYVKMKVEGLNLTFINEGPIEIKVSNVVKKGHLNRNSVFSVSADFTNVSREGYCGGLTALLYDGKTGNILQVVGLQTRELKKDVPQNVEFCDVIQAGEGKCLLALVDHDYTILYQEEVTVGSELPATNVSAELIDVPENLGIYSTPEFTIRLTNSSNIDFYDKIMTVFAFDNRVQQIFSEGVYDVPAGKSVDITVKGMVDPQSLNTFMFAVVNRNFAILAYKNVTVEFSKVPLLYLQSAPELSGYSYFSRENDCPVFENNEITYSARLRNLGANKSGVLNMNLFKMMGDVPDLVVSERENVNVRYTEYCNVQHTFSGVALEPNQKYMCEMYYANNTTPVDGENSRAYFIYTGPAGVESVLSQSVAVYPNPVEDVLNIVSESPVMSVEIYSMQGVRVMAAEGVSELNVSELRPAAYIAVIVTENGKTTASKIVKK